MITKTWLCEAVPNNWSKAVLLPLFKKGDKRICSYYGGTSLIDVAVKVFGATPLKSFQPERDQRTRPNQRFLRPGRGCTDKMHNLPSILLNITSLNRTFSYCQRFSRNGTTPFKAIEGFFSRKPDGAYSKQRGQGWWQALNMASRQSGRQPNSCSFIFSLNYDSLNCSIKKLKTALWP